MISQSNIPEEKLTAITSPVCTGRLTVPLYPVFRVYVVGAPLMVTVTEAPFQPSPKLSSIWSEYTQFTGAAPPLAVALSGTGPCPAQIT